MRFLRICLVLIVLFSFLQISVFAGRQERPVTIQIASGTWNEPALDILIPKFEQQNPGISVEPLYIAWLDYVRTITTLMRAGQAPEVMCLKGIWLPDWGKDYLQSLTDLGYEQSVDLADWDQSQLEAYYHDGHLYGFPFRTSPHIFMYNEDVFVDAGYPSDYAPKTWDDFLELLKAITASGDRHGMTIMLNDPGNAAMFFQHFLYTAGGSVMNEDGTATTINSPEALRALTWLTDLLKVHAVVPRSALSDDLEQMTGYLYGGRVGIIEHSTSVINSAARNRPEVPIGTFPMPAEKPGDPYPGVGIQSDGWGLSIAKNTDHLEEAQKLVEFLIEPENLAILTIDLPSRRAAWDYSPRPGHLAFTDERYDGVAIAQQNMSLPIEPPPDRWHRILYDVIWRMQQRAFVDLTPQEALNWAEAQINAILAE